MSSFSVKIVWQGETLEVSGNAWKSYGGDRERGTGLLLSPPEPAGFEIEEIIFKGVNIVDLFDRDLEGITEKVQKELERS